MSISKIYYTNSDKKSLVNARRDAARQRCAVFVTPCVLGRAEFNAGTQRSRDAEQRREKRRYERRGKDAQNLTQRSRDAERRRGKRRYERRGKDARCSSPHASSDAQNLTQGRRDAERRRGKRRYERRGKDARCSSPHASSDAQNLTQGRREAETQSREERRGDTSGEAKTRRI